MYQRGTACYKVRREYTATVKNPNPYMRRVWPIDKELPPFEIGRASCRERV